MLFTYMREMYLFHWSSIKIPLKLNTCGMKTSEKGSKMCSISPLADMPKMEIRYCTVKRFNNCIFVVFCYISFGFIPKITTLPTSPG